MPALHLARAVPLRRASKDGVGAGTDRWAYRPDIDGLRAVAILLVVTYHVWSGRVSGGVDVFLMLSAFFLTRAFVKRMAGPSPIHPGKQLLKVFRRLLPAAAVTLLGVLAVVWLVYPPTAWASVWEQTWASLTYTQNWLLAADAVDYYARAEAPSPLQHFWSMSVQGQTFILWIALLWLCQIVVRKAGVSPDRAVAVTFGLVFAASFIYSVVRTDAAQQAAYFDTGARLWEFAAGSLLVVILPRIRLSPVMSSFTGWAGLAGLLVLGMVLDVQGGFPGYLALWPVVCAAAIVLSGSQEEKFSPSRLLSSRPLRALGGDAYALYLVHWPILVTWMIVRERSEIGLLGGVVIIGLSLLAARLMTILVDNPLRSWRSNGAGVVAPIAVILVSALAVVTPLAVWQGVVERREQIVAEQAAAANPGAAVLWDESIAEPPSSASTLPLPTALDGEWTQLERPCTLEWSSDADILHGTCFETAHTARAERTIAVIGDSHSQQLTSALLPVAEERGWGVVTLIKGACSMGLDEVGPDPENCDAWRDSAVSLIENAAPMAVMTVVTRADHSDDDETARDGIERFLNRMQSAGIDVWGVRDNPRFAFDMFGCLLDQPDPQDCAVPRGSSLAASNPALALARPGLHLIDFTPWLCPDDVCPAVIGNVAVYFDSHHVTASYARTLAPVLASQLPDDLP